MNSKEIAESVYQWALQQNFTAPYGVLGPSEHINSKGRKFVAVTFGYARTLDATVEVYNRNFILLRTSSWGSEVFKDYNSLMQKLKENYD